MNNSPNDNSGPPAKGCGERTRPLKAVAALLLAIVVLISLPPARPARADPPPTGEFAAGEFAAADRPAQQRTGADEDRERVVTIGVSLVLIVALCGGLLLLLVIVGGRYVRRIARKPLPGASPRDELWYLKTRSELAARELRNRAGADSPRPAQHNDPPPDSSREEST